MADISTFDRAAIEKFLKMGNGYVLEFSNRTFEEFVKASINIDPYADKYDLPETSGSKANRLRGVFNVEQNYKVGTLLEDLANHRKVIDELSDRDKALCERVLKIASHLKSHRIVENIEAIKERIEDMDFSILVKSIRDSIEKNEPETAIDRLHTYLIHFYRQLCSKHSIEYTKNATLNALGGMYIKKIKAKGLIESSMTERILKSSLGILETYNDVRNNKSLAHPNKVLNYDESLLIVNSISNDMRFIQSVENKYEGLIKSEEQKKNPQNPVGE